MDPDLYLKFWASDVKGFMILSKRFEMELLCFGGGEAFISLFIYLLIFAELYIWQKPHEFQKDIPADFENIVQSFQKICFEYNVPKFHLFWTVWQLFWKYFPIILPVKGICELL